MFDYNKPLLEQYEEEYSKDPEYIAEGLALKITEEMLKILHNNNQTQTWLAEKMGVSRARVSRILNARPNITLLTIAQISVALGVKPDVSLLEIQPTDVVFLSATQSEAPIDQQKILGTAETFFKPVDASSEPVIKTHPTYQMITA